MHRRHYSINQSFHQRKHTKPMRLICFDPIHIVSLLADLIIIGAACIHHNVSSFVHCFDYFEPLFNLVLNFELKNEILRIRVCVCVHLCLDLTIKSHELSKSLSISTNYSSLCKCKSQIQFRFLRPMRYIKLKNAAFGCSECICNIMHSTYTIRMSLARYSPSASASAMHISRMPCSWV